MTRKRKKAKPARSGPDIYKILFFVLLLLAVGVVVYEVSTHRPAFDPARGPLRELAQADSSAPPRAAPAPPPSAPPPSAARPAPPKARADPAPISAATLTQVPDFYHPTQLPGEQKLRYAGFTLSYNERHRQASWVAYRLSAERATGDEPRYNNFREEKRVNSASPRDYRGTGFDRGHLAPAGDMKWLQRVMEESFLMTNISPQAPAFNRGIWRELEEQVRRWAVQHGEVYVVTGPVLAGKLPTIGDNQVSVPKYYYKVVLDGVEPDIRAIGFLMENKGSAEPLQNFVVSISQLETLTGLDFFPNLPPATQRTLESRKDLRGWFEPATATR